ncbi:MAG TPA: 3-methyl-2-oxobutanoate hydroxymethyltransferase, partial [Streptosporangiaceae bacterium]
CIPSALAAQITKELMIPTIGIGAGGGCDGQVLVVNDLLGLTSGYVPRFVKQYADLKSVITATAQNYIGDVRSGAFPGPEQEFR